MDTGRTAATPGTWPVSGMESSAEQHAAPEATREAVEGPLEAAAPEPLPQHVITFTECGILSMSLLSFVVYLVDVTSHSMP